MKLPEDPKERSQILALVGIFGAIALYGIYMGVSVMFLKPEKVRQKKIAELTEKLSKADSDVEMMPILKDNNTRYTQEITRISDEYVLHPQLGNLLIPAEQFIREQEAAAGVTVLEVKEIGINEFPAPEAPPPVKDESGKTKIQAAPNKDYAFKIYTARVDVANGLHDVIKLVKQIESANPFVCISSINIAPQEETPFQHRISLDVQWPIWNANKSTEKILQLLNSSSFRESIMPPADTKPAPKAKKIGKAKKNDKAAPEADDSVVNAKLKELGVNIDEN